MPALSALNAVPNGVALPPQGVTDQDPAFYDWLATQPQATRKFYTEDRLNNDPSSSASNRHKHIRAAQDMLQSAITKVISAGGTVPDVDPVTGVGMSFSSPAAKAEFLKLAAIRTTEQPQKEAAGLTPQDLAVNPTAIPTDEEAAHPELYQAQQQAIAQNRTDTTGLQAQQQSIADETAAINQGGLTAVDRARLLDSQMKRGMEARAQEQAIMQGAEQQGRAGGQAQLVARQNAQQASSNQQAQENAQTMALGLERKDTLMASRATQGLGMQNAQDVLDAFNTKNQRDVNAANTDIYNKAEAAGNTARTNTNLGNTAIANTAEYYNKGQGGMPGVIGLQTGANAPTSSAQGAAGDTAAAKGAADAAAKAQQDALNYGLAGTIIGGVASVGSEIAK